MRKVLYSYVLLLLLNSLTGCFDMNTKQEYYQFTSDDLNHLYIGTDSLVYSGSIVYYSDSLSFLRNSSDTILVEVNTRIYDERQPWNDVNALAGISEMNFNEQSGFKFACVKLFKDGISTDIYISFQMLVGGCNDEILDVPLDTARVLEKTYNNVYKFEYPSYSQTKLKRLYFAKKYGFILVETTDGRLLERLDI